MNQKPCPADGSTTRPWTALEASFAEDGDTWGFFTCEAYKDLERRKKALDAQRAQIDEEWKIMLLLEARVHREQEQRRLSREMQNPTKVRN